MNYCSGSIFFTTVLNLHYSELIVQKFSHFEILLREHSLEGDATVLQLEEKK